MFETTTQYGLPATSESGLGAENVRVTPKGSAGLSSTASWAPGIAGTVVLVDRYLHSLGVVILARQLQRDALEHVPRRIRSGRKPLGSSSLAEFNTPD